MHELFSKSGDVKRIIIGLDKVKKTACGFCFVEYPFISFFFYYGFCYSMRCACFKSVSALNPRCTRYYTRAGAENAMRFINGTRLDDRIIRTDWDAGFKEGRQYGRGKSGGQVRNFHMNWYVLCILFSIFLFVIRICSVPYSLHVNQLCLLTGLVSAYLETKRTNEIIHKNTEIIYEMISPCVYPNPNPSDSVFIN